MAWRRDAQPRACKVMTPGLPVRSPGMGDSNAVFPPHDPICGGWQPSPPRAGARCRSATPGWAGRAGFEIENAQNPFVTVGTPTAVVAKPLHDIITVAAEKAASLQYSRLVKASGVKVE